VADLNNLSWVEEALAPTSDPGWVLHEEGYDPTREAGIEARFAIGNGFIGVRGSRSVSRGPTWTSYQHNISWASWPRTYVAGLFDTPNTEPPVPALVPAPDWLRVRIWIDGKLALIRSGVLLAHHRWLDMRRGLLLTEWRQKWDDRSLHMRTLRFVSQVDRGLGGQLLQLEVDGPPTEVQLEASFEAAGSALECLDAAEDLVVWCTPQTRKTLAIASMAQLRLNGRKLEPQHTNLLDRRWVWTSVPGQKITVLRLVAFARGEKEDNSAAIAVQTTLDRVRHIGWRNVLTEHEEAWSRRWAASDLEIAGDAAAQQAMRFAIYHLISAANPQDDRVSVGARALTGDSYLGHVFWDTEIYLLPFYTLTWPEAARALLLYRYRTLDGARAKAVRMGYRGAFFAWESADTGEETTPEKIIDPNGRVIEVLCGKEEWHIVADVAYALWQYWQMTGDDAFMLDAGAEILFETARFWASCAVLEDDGRYHIRGIIGPDEYHEHIDDNAFTNEMARWNLERATEFLGSFEQQWPERCRELLNTLGLGDEELALWRDVAQRLIRQFNEDTGLFEQFEGYFKLEDIDLGHYEGRTVPMDVVLGRERTQKSQVLKQADVVALIALQDSFDRRVVEENFRYYGPRCGHGSSLSHGLHGVVAARLGETEAALAHFRKTAEIDLGPTTVPSAGGIRIAAQGGLWQVAILGFAGLRTTAEGLRLDPSLPASWRSMRFRACWRGRVIELRIEQDPRLVTAVLDKGEPLRLRVKGRECTVAAGTPQRLEWGQPEPYQGGKASSAAP
jgi:trehalose/maltose hydrolase-like predicted phosphorylase